MEQSTAPVSTDEANAYSWLPGLFSHILMGWDAKWSKSDKRKQQAKLERAAVRVVELHDYASTLPDTSAREAVLKALRLANDCLFSFRTTPVPDVTNKSFEQHLARKDIQADVLAAYSMLRDTQMD